jgi:hypothetical protein
MSRLSETNPREDVRRLNASQYSPGLALGAGGAIELSSYAVAV